MRTLSCSALVLLLVAAPLACGGEPAAADEGAATSSESGSESSEETGGLDPICEATQSMFLSLSGPYGTDSPTDMPLLQALQYQSQTAGTGSASDCPCGVDCTNQPVGMFEFDMFGLDSLPACFTVEYAVRADADEGAWIVFRNANEGSAGQLVLAAATDPATLPPSLSGLTVESAGLTECDEYFAAVRLRFSWGAASIELENGESGELETPMGTITIYNLGSQDIYEGVPRNGWIMVPAGTVLGG